MSELSDKINKMREERAANERYVVILCAYGGMVPSNPMSLDEGRDMVNFYTELNAPAILTQEHNAGAIIRALHFTNNLALTPECEKYYRGKE